MNHFPAKKGEKKEEELPQLICTLLREEPNLVSLPVDRLTTEKSGRNRETEKRREIRRQTKDIFCKIALSANKRHTK